MVNMESDSLLKEIDEIFKGKLFLTIQDIMALLSCDENTIYNWTKRSNPSRRPPRIIVGRELRFPKKAFLQWLLQEQSGLIVFGA